VYLDFHRAPPVNVAMKRQIELKGKPKRLAVLDYGLFEVHAGPRTIGICGFVIQTDADEVVLIDTGFPQKYAEDAEAATAEDDLGSFGRVLRVTHDNMPDAQLARLGLGASDVTLMIQSHTHIDHVGHLAAFAHVPILISAAERALPRPLYWSGKQAMEWPDADYHLVEGDMTLGAGFEVLHCPGHAPGQLAFVVRLPLTGWVLLTSDAISRASEIDEQFAGSWDVEQAIFHGDRLMRLAAERNAQVIFGHSPEQWPVLKKAPEWFE
jgi:N-acyl homoserine lactone hydrolase